jgi:hypothetical protein
MRSLRERLRRVRWLTIPLSAYLFVTLVLPAANGAARRADFVVHALWVLGCCAAIVGILVLGPTFADLVRPSLWRKR